jgi:hypothetical protein
MLRIAISRGMLKGVPRKSQSEIEDHYREQMQFLRSSAAAYDAGDSTEALRLAVSLRVLLHDTPQSTSILTQLGVKTDLAFVDTALMPVVKVPDSTFVGAVLAPMVMGVPDSGYRARLADGGVNPPMIFHHWWYSIVIGIWDGEFTR